jgi:sugar phosphate isomerase/epimerase
MIVALHGAPKGFFKTEPPRTNDDLARLVKEAASLGFKAFEIGPLEDYVPIEGERLRTLIDSLNMERSVHVGGIFDARRLALEEEEYTDEQRQIRYGIGLCEEVSSTLVSFHPPFFATRDGVTEELVSKARMRFLALVKEEVELAGQKRIKMALESFCYRPFVFEGLKDFSQFVSSFPSDRLGVLLEVGHLYQAGIDLTEAVHASRNRLLDIHIHDATLEKDFRKATHLPIGRGTIDFPTIINLLREAEYGGWLTLEIRGSEAEIKRSKEYLEKLIAGQ